MILSYNILLTNDMYKINRYLFIQLFKYFILIFFIFLTVAWLLQLTRLFTISNFIQIDILSIIFLSLFLIPNILTIILPFILIFGILLCYIKLSKDKELISIFSLGLDLNPIKKSIKLFSYLILFIYIILSFYISPKIYEIYKQKEFDLRNTINFDNIIYSNFININKNTILDFKKKGNLYEDIFISYIDTKENIIYAKKGQILNDKNKYNFRLSDGFKISIDAKNQIEKLEFLNYVFDIENNVKLNLNIDDENTYTIFDDISKKNYKNILYRIIDIIFLLFIIIFFYFNNIKKLSFNSNNNTYFVINCLLLLISNQILKNTEILLYSYFIIINIIVFSIIFVFIFKNKYEQN